jgi:MFS family permease
MKFRSTPLSKLLTSEVLNTTSSAILVIATPLIAITLLNADALSVGILAACGTGAPLLFGLSAGVLAERWNRKKILFWCSIARLLLVLLAAILAYFEKLNMGLLCCLSFAISMIKLLFDSVVVAIIPTIVVKSDLTKANSWYEATNSSAYALGPAIGGWILQSFSSTAVYAINALLYLASTFFVNKIELPLLPASSESRKSHLSDIAQGVRLLWRNETQRAIAIAAGLFNFFHTAFFTIFTLYALRELGFSATSFGTTITFVGLAGLLAAFFAPKMIEYLGVRTALIGTLLIIGPLGLPIIFSQNLPFFQRTILIACCFALWDFLIVVHVIVEQTIRQITVNNRHLSRITATTRFISWGADPIGALFGGALAASAIGSRGALFICLLGFFLSAIMLLTSKNIRNLDGNVLKLMESSSE